MNWEDASAYLVARDQLQAEETLLALRVADYPQLKADERKQFHRSLRRMAFPVDESKMPQLSTEDLAQRLRMVIAHG